MNTENINYPELICALIEQIRLSSKLPKTLIIKHTITVNGIDYQGEIIPYAMRTDKNGYPHFLFCLNSNWVWLSAKHFKTSW